MSVRTLPKFATEAEEAAWWFENREKHDVEFEQAFLEGRVRKSSIAQRLIAANKGLILMIPSPDAVTAAHLADQKGVEVREYLATLIHKALEQETVR